MTSSEWRQSESLKGRSNTSQISCLASSDLCWQCYFPLVLKSVSRNCSDSVRGTQLTCLCSTRLTSAALIKAQTRQCSNCNDLWGSPPTQLKNLTSTATQHEVLFKVCLITFLIFIIKYHLLMSKTLHKIEWS